MVFSGPLKFYLFINSLELMNFFFGDHFEGILLAFCLKNLVGDGKDNRSLILNNKQLFLLFFLLFKKF